MKKYERAVSFEEKFVCLNEGLKREIWQAISFTSSKQMLEKAKMISSISHCQHRSLEQVIIFFMDFFEVLLRSKLIRLTEKEVYEFKKLLLSKGAKGLFELGEEINGDILRYKQNDIDMFYPVKILERVLFGDHKDFARLIDFLTSGDYPQDTILQKWMNEYGENRYLLDF